MHIIPHALSLLVAVQCVTQPDVFAVVNYLVVALSLFYSTVLNTNFQCSKLGHRSKTQCSTLRQRTLRLRAVYNY